MNWTTNNKTSSTSSSNGSQSSPVLHDRTMTNPFSAQSTPQSTSMEQPHWASTAIVHSTFSTPDTSNRQTDDGSYYTCSSEGCHPSSESYRTRTSSTDSSFVSPSHRHHNADTYYSSPIVQIQTHPMKLAGLCTPDLSPSNDPVPGRMPIGNFQSSPGSTTTDSPSDLEENDSPRVVKQNESNPAIDVNKTAADIRREKIAIAKSKKLLEKTVPKQVYTDSNEEVEALKKSIDVRRQKRAHAKALHLLNKTVSGMVDESTAPSTSERRAGEFVFRPTPKSDVDENSQCLGNAKAEQYCDGKSRTNNSYDMHEIEENEKVQEQIVVDQTPAGQTRQWISNEQARAIAREKQKYQKYIVKLKECEEKEKFRSAVANAHLATIARQLNPKLAETTRVVKPKQCSGDDEDDSTETITSMKCKMHLEQEEEAKQRALRLLAFSALD